MWTWIEANLYWIVPTILAWVAERVHATTPEWKRRCATVVDAVERAGRIYPKDSPEGQAIADLKRMVGTFMLPKDRAPVGDLIAEAGDDKHGRSTGRKVAAGVLQLLPFVSRFVRFGKDGTA